MGRLDCLYYIRVNDTSKAIRLEFTKFEVERSEDCDKDYVRVYDFSRWTPRLCGIRLPAPVIGQHGDLYLEFITDHGGRAGGWEVTWSTVDKARPDEKSPLVD